MGHMILLCHRLIAQKPLPCSKSSLLSMSLLNEKELILPIRPYLLKIIQNYYGFSNSF